MPFECSQNPQTNESIPLLNMFSFSDKESDPEKVRSGTSRLVGASTDCNWVIQNTSHFLWALKPRFEYREWANIEAQLL